MPTRGTVISARIPSTKEERKEFEKRRDILAECFARRCSQVLRPTTPNSRTLWNTPLNATSSAASYLNSPAELLRRFGLFRSYSANSVPPFPSKSVSSQLSVSRSSRGFHFAPVTPLQLYCLSCASPLQVRSAKRALPCRYRGNRGWRETCPPCLRLQMISLISTRSGVCLPRPPLGSVSLSLTA